MVGSKLLKLLIYPLTDLALGAVGEKFAAAWEGKYRPYGTRFFEPAGYRTKGLAQLQDADWDRLAQGPNLWFVHGTFSTSHGGFYQLPPEFLGASTRSTRTGWWRSTIPRCRSIRWPTPPS